MLDVHPPHAPTHTWRDFLIHIATIVIGLLIAIGLEQTVEAIHHASERREVIAQFREEAGRNVITLRRDIDVLLPEADWDLAVIAALKQAPAKNGYVQITLPGHAPFGHNRQPNRSVWTLATSNGKAALLPEERAQSYEILDRGAAQVLQATEARNTAAIAVHQVELQAQIKIASGKNVSMPTSQVALVVEKLAARASALQFEAQRDAILIGACDAASQDILDPREVGELIGKEANALIARLGTTF